MRWPRTARLPAPRRSGATPSRPAGASRQKVQRASTLLSSSRRSPPAGPAAPAARGATRRASTAPTRGAHSHIPQSRSHRSPTPTHTRTHHHRRPVPTRAAGRYHLYVSLACPWACRCVAALHLKGLTGAVGLSVTHPTWQRTRPDAAGDAHCGWAFRSPGDAPVSNPAGQGSFGCRGCVPDGINGASFVRDLYELAGDTGGALSGQPAAPQPAPPQRRPRVCSARVRPARPRRQQATLRPLETHTIPWEPPMRLIPWTPPETNPLGAPLGPQGSGLFENTTASS